MNYKLHNLDLTILQREARSLRFGRAPGWMRVDWKPTALGGNMIYLRQAALPPNCSVERTDIKIEAPPNLYQPLGGGLFAFYQNLWISPDIRVFDKRRQAWMPLPRLHSRDGDGFAYFCIHPGPVRQGKNILDFIRVMDLFFLNPGYKATAGEQF